VARPLTDILAHAGELVDQEVAVVGPIVIGSGRCTALYCGNGCCNDCARTLQVGLGHMGDDDRHERATTVRLFGPAALCRGDESLQCCPIDAHGQELVAHGLFHIYGSTYAIDPTELCAIESDGAVTSLSGSP